MSREEDGVEGSRGEEPRGQHERDPEGVEEARDGRGVRSREARGGVGDGGERRGRRGGFVEGGFGGRREEVGERRGEEEIGDLV